MLSQIKVAGERGIGLAVEFGPTAKVLSAAAADLGASLLVVGDQERTGIDRTVVGSTTVEVIRKAPCPVVVFPSKPAPTRAGPLVCGVDQSKSALAATRAAARMARQLELKLVLVNAVEGSRGAEDTFDRELQAARDHLPEGSIELIAQPGAPVDVLPQVGRELEAEMIFVGSRGLGVIRRALLGSVSTALLQETDDRPVVVVPDGTDEEGGGG
jgi:nucleotide-binding universal stress UspA family protein